jgi:hypothetical protein
VTCILIATAVLSGVFLALVLSLFGSPPEGLFSVLPLGPSGRPEIVLNSTSPPPLISPPPPPPQYKNHDDDDHLGLEELRDLVAQTKGYFVRDYSLGLGWNNVRIARTQGVIRPFNLSTRFDTLLKLLYYMPSF